ncbi:MAG: GNAT family N-acetyltransferase [Flavobacteriales bacterium]
MEIKIVKHYSKDYWKMVKLRDKILREPLNLMFSEEELFLENEQIHIGGFEGDKAIASLSLVKLSPTLLKMRQVCVSATHQGKNLGKELVLFAENWAKENEYSQIECNARESAVPFYKSNTYKIEGEQFFELRIPHFKMTKDLI